jgi:transcriptional regulator with XRE-family HTH domain
MWQATTPSEANMTVIDAAQWPSRDDSGGHDMPSPFLAERLKTLRAEAGWSQTELAEKIDSDGRQVSRYENGRITPSLEALVRIAETFNVSVDYLVIEDAHRRPLHSAENILGDKLADLATLEPDDQAAMLKVLDALVMKHKLQALTGGAS